MELAEVLKTLAAICSGGASALGRTPRVADPVFRWRGFPSSQALKLSAALPI
jgi:hypothetical protein